MIVTIEEAQETMCPILSERGNGQDCTCFGPKCMAWRAVEPTKGFCGMVPVWPEFKREKDTR